MFDLNTLLVPVDFSAPSREAVAQALRLAAGEDRAVILLHVIDRSQLNFAEQQALAGAVELAAKLREQAEAELAKMVAELNTQVDVQTVVSEGVPFAEIVKKAEEFQVDAVVLAKFGVHGRAENMLFGATAERVIRWAGKPVIVLPLG